MKFIAFLYDKSLAAKFAELKAEAETIAAEGWKWIEVAISFPYGHDDGLRQVEGTPADITTDEQATIEALQAEHAKLEAEDRLSWLDEEHANLLDPQVYDTTPEKAWERLKLRKTTADYVFTLQVAAAWRERQAQARDVPRGRVVKDDALYEIAEHRPKSAGDFDRMRAVPRGFGNSRAAQELVAALDRAFWHTVSAQAVFLYRKAHHRSPHLPAPP